MIVRVRGDDRASWGDEWLQTNEKTAKRGKRAFFSLFDGKVLIVRFRYIKVTVKEGKKPVFPLFSFRVMNYCGDRCLFTRLAG